ncbi:SGNH/GDSL hydrolase family protein [Pseudoduganella chitinolytica]|uniref:SGNH/GDSL hydrolase family protein n=1 Tax=Pseudoduganella chitinolytica TaxID=34070 RepID=A0ABY8BGR0_9BURK|nr:SGNH/GDSL hydrolase family protein [Pseudoduganella chitinolytica]WEF35115.1 SGNH/GDSL hydrolase family protein [Pseudoduganella chitinolytica]
MHIALLGDSIFDNAAYVAPGADVAAALRRRAPGWRVTLLARDGAVLAGIPAQLERLRTVDAPPDRLVVSCGGNDILGLQGLLHTPAGTLLAALDQLAAWRDDFRRAYAAMLEAVLATKLPVTACTVYDAVPGVDAARRCAVGIFDDVIAFEAGRRGMPVLDLRAVCDEAADYSPRSPIEPSAQGSEKIAAAIVRLATTAALQ